MHVRFILIRKIRTINVNIKCQLYSLYLVPVRLTKTVGRKVGFWGEITNKKTDSDICSMNLHSMLSNFLSFEFFILNFERVLQQ